VLEQAAPVTEEHQKHLRRLERRFTGAMATRRALPATPLTAEDDRRPPVPSWWVDDEDASASSTAAMKQLR
jgi:hypothetical protein